MRMAWAWSKINPWRWIALWKAIHGDPEDMNALAYLGLFYEQGIGVEKNLEQALSCYRQAAEHGDPMAQFTLGMCYFFGNGVEEDLQTALKWVNAAAEQDWPRHSTSWACSISWANG